MGIDRQHGGGTMAEVDFRGVTCGLCGVEESTRTGEHVVPRWLLRRLFPPAEPGQAGYTIERNGDPVISRGKVRTTSEASHFRMPMCRLCNDRLSERFENGATKDAVEKLLCEGDDRALQREDVHLASLWLIKTTMLMAHPATVNTDEHWTSVPDAWPLDHPELWVWMTNGGEPPDGISLWIARFSRLDTSGSLDRSIGRIQLPEIRFEGGDTVKFLENAAGLADTGYAVVYHPGWQIDHPHEAAGMAVRLWPNPPTSLDFNRLAELEGQAAADFQSLFQRQVGLFIDGDLLEPGADPLRIGWEKELAIRGGSFVVPRLRGMYAR